MDTTTTISPQHYARFGGLLYLVIIIAGVMGELMIRGTMVLPVNPNRDDWLSGSVSGLPTQPMALQVSVQLRYNWESASSMTYLEKSP